MENIKLNLVSGGFKLIVMPWHSVVCGYYSRRVHALQHIVCTLGKTWIDIVGSRNKSRWGREAFHAGRQFRLQSALFPNTSELFGIHQSCSIHNQKDLWKTFLVLLSCFVRQYWRHPFCLGFFSQFTRKAIKLFCGSPIDHAIYIAICIVL